MSDTSIIIIAGCPVQCPLSDTGPAVSMTQRKFSMKKMALKSTFGFTTVNHYYTEEERQVCPRPIPRFCNYKKNMFLKQIRSLLLDYYWSWMSSNSSWKILFYHHIWDWPQKWLKISCLVRDFYISRPLRPDTQHRPLSREHREEIFFLADREILTIYWEKKSHIENWEQYSICFAAPQHNQ